jgi:hypothetical protein
MLINGSIGARVPEIQMLAIELWFKLPLDLQQLPEQSGSWTDGQVLSLLSLFKVLLQLLQLMMLQL